MNKSQCTYYYVYFNYRSDADVPVPYGRTVALKTPTISSSDPLTLADLVPNWKDKKRDALVAILISNCGVSYRMSVIKKIKEYIPVHAHGKCGDNDLKNRYVLTIFLN